MSGVVTKNGIVTLGAEGVYEYEMVCPFEMGWTDLGGNVWQSPTGSKVAFPFNEKPRIARMKRPDHE